MPWCALLTAVKNCNKSVEKLPDFFFKTETKTKTKSSRPRPTLHDPRPRPRLSFLSSRRLVTQTLVSRTTSLLIGHVWFDKFYSMFCRNDGSNILYFLPEFRHTVGFTNKRQMYGFMSRQMSMHGRRSLHQPECVLSRTQRHRSSTTVRSA